MTWLSGFFRTIYRATKLLCRYTQRQATPLKFQIHERRTILHNTTGLDKKRITLSIRALLLTFYNLQDSLLYFRFIH